MANGFSKLPFLVPSYIAGWRGIVRRQMDRNECAAETVKPLSKDPPSTHTAASTLVYHRLRTERPDLNLPAIKSYVSPIDWTPELWGEAVTLFRDLNTQAMEAQRRLTFAESKILEWLRDGKLKSYLRPSKGGQFSRAQDATLWNTESWGNRFAAGMMNPKDPFGFGIAGDDYQYIFVDSKDLDNCIGEAIFARTGQTAGESQKPPLHFQNRARWGILPTLVGLPHVTQNLLRMLPQWARRFKAKKYDYR